MASSSKKRVAIIGSGVSGIGALYALRNAEVDVHLFEASTRLGGHTNTVVWNAPGTKSPVKVDTGFIVLNSFTYPNFIRFLKELKIDTVDTDMSFSVTRDHGKFEWCGSNVKTLFAQRSNMFSPRFWRMIFDVMRFNAFALDLLDDPDSDLNQISVGQYLEQHGYSDAFKDDYLIPMTACIWSTGPDKCALDFPAVTLVRFMWNHHLLTVTKRPTWMTIPGGSKKYLDAVIERSLPPSREHRNTAIAAIRASKNKDGKNKYILQSPRGTDIPTKFDEVIFACHADQALNILGNFATREERSVLSKFQTTDNIAYLHNDLSFMPIRREAWAAWNYLTTSPKPTSATTASSRPTAVTLTYNMNILQHINAARFSDVLVTLNPARIPDPEKTQSIIPYRHPLYTAEAVAAQRRLALVSGQRGLHWAGAWTGYGFHEDGFVSGVRAGIACGGTVPWKVVDNKEIRGKSARKERDLAWEVARLACSLIMVLIRLWGLLLVALLVVEQSLGIERGEKKVDGEGEVIGPVPKRRGRRWLTRN